MDGILNVYKPKGYTSHDIVNIMRKLFGIKRIGHTGTLDPNAEGVLPICIGKGTKTADMLTVTDKSYRAEILLGIVTDSQDITGNVLEKNEVNVTCEDIYSVIKNFIGKQNQIPPMYSAVKVGGKKLYELARKGIEIERKPREIEIYNIKIVKYDLENSKFTIDVSCSKGTYIRSLCKDIGEKLGCGATLFNLTRTKSGIFDIESSLTIEEIQDYINNKNIENKLVQVDRVFSDYEKLEVCEEIERLILNGVAPKLDSLDIYKYYRVYNKDNKFLCVSQAIKDNDKVILKLKKSFYG